MKVKIGEWEIEVKEGYFEVSFPLGEHTVQMFYSGNGALVKHFVQVNIDNARLARIDIPELDDVNPS